MNENITIEDLKTGYKAKLRNEKIVTILKNCSTEFYGEPPFVLLGDNFFDISNNYTIGWKHESETDYDIMEIRTCNINRDYKNEKYEELPILWTRYEPLNNIYQFDFETMNAKNHFDGNATMKDFEYFKHRIILVAKDQNEAWEKFYHSMDSYLAKGKRFYNPTIKNITADFNGVIYNDLKEEVVNND